MAAVQRRTGAQVAIHALDAPVVAGRAHSPKGGSVMALLRRLLRVQAVEPDVALRDGDTIDGLRVLHVPGHTPGSIVLARDDGVVFSGDALLADRRGRVLPPNPRLCLDPAQAAASAEKIAALHDRLLPGHGAPAIP